MFVELVGKQLSRKLEKIKKPVIQQAGFRNHLQTAKVEKAIIY